MVESGRFEPAYHGNLERFQKMPGNGVCSEGESAKSYGSRGHMIHMAVQTPC